MHSKIDDRLDRDLRGSALGEFEMHGWASICVEVSDPPGGQPVCTLDADKEGFLQREMLRIQQRMTGCWTSM